MSNSMIDYIRKLIEGAEIPANDSITDEAIARYESGQNVLIMYHGDPDVLIQALRTFVSTQVRPLFYAGAAHVVISAAYLSGSTYDAEGINYALALYDRALYYNSDSLQIALLNVALLGQRKLHDEMRATLDRIRYEYPGVTNEMGYIFAEMDYWKTQSDLVEYERWANLGLDHARNNIHRLTVLNRVAGIYLSLPKYAGAKEALAYYEKVVTLNPNDPWAWHNMSILHRHNGNYERTAYCNSRALE